MFKFKLSFYQLNLFFSIALFFLLLLQNPFSSQNIISDLYPYPDSFNYLNPALNFWTHHNFAIWREGRSIPTTVPPLYSVVLAPFFLFSLDPRIFYIANVFLSFISAGLFFLVLKKITSNKLIIGVSFFLYVTNFCLYWYPSFPMAENLSLPFILGGIYLLIQKSSTLKIILIGLIALALIFTKYALIPVSLSFFLLLIGKEIFEAKTKSNRLYRLKQLAILLTILIIVYVVLSQFVSGLDLFSRIKYLLDPSQGFFSTNNLSDNLTRYFASLLGIPIRFTQHDFTLVPVLAGMLGLPALFVGLFSRQFRFLSLILLCLTFSSIFFIAFFQEVDGRYTYHLIPTILLSFVIFWELLLKYLQHKKIAALFQVLILSFLISYLLQTSNQLFNWTISNWYHSEIAFNYQTVEQYNRYFLKSNGTKKPIVISSLVPYFVDFYSNDNYRLLPLSTRAYFANYTEQVWGPDNYHDLFALYETKLNQGYSLYVSDSGIYYWNTKYLLRNFQTLKEKYDLNLVDVGCQGGCRLYQIKKANLN